MTRENKIFFEDVARKSLAALIVCYLLFFGAESVLPGAIMDIFNLNISLAVIFLILGGLLFFGSDLGAEPGRIFQGSRFFGAIKLAAFLIFAAFFMIVTFKVTLVESGFYLILTAISARILRGFFVY